MNETQRAAAERLVDNMNLSLETWIEQAENLLRELLAEPEPAPGYCKHCKQYTIEQPLPAEPDEDAQYRCGGPGCDGNCCQPVQEPVIWIQSNHLQHAKNGPYLARTGPTKLMSDFIPLYAAPQQRKPLTDEAIEAILDEFDVDREAWKPLARAIEKAHGITGEPT